MYLHLGGTCTGAPSGCLWIQRSGGRMYTSGPWVAPPGWAHPSATLGIGHTHPPLESSGDLHGCGVL